MSDTSIIYFILIDCCIISYINYQYHKIDILNYKILQQKEIINKISNICDNLSISKIVNYTDTYNISYRYSNISIIIITINTIIIPLFIIIKNDYNNSFSFIFIISILIIVIIYDYNKKYIHKKKIEINNKAIEIINKINEI
jgi:hypothetical protein